MKAIYKYKLEITDTQDILVPQGAVFMSCIVQGDNMVAYFLVDNEDVKSRDDHFVIIGTGNPIERDLSKLDFIGTYSMPNGLVWHVFRKEGVECYDY